MAAFRTWLIAGFFGALCATLWLGAFVINEPKWWNFTMSIGTFLIAIGYLTWKFRPSQVAHAVPATSAGYAIGWDVVQGTNATGLLGLSPYLVIIMALALSTAVAIGVTRIQEGRSGTSELPA
ncbi:MAG: hypothetical protein GX678_00370 [Actinomycetales bacterium]|nr:hypothetical protein [Actinomycetales bacterium]